MKIQYATLPLASLFFLYSSYSVSNMQAVNECEKGCSTTHHDFTPSSARLTASSHRNTIANASYLASDLIQTQLPVLQQRVDAMQSSQVVMQAIHSGMHQWFSTTNTTPTNTGNASSVDQLVNPHSSQIDNKVAHQTNNNKKQDSRAFRRVMSNAELTNITPTTPEPPAQTNAQNIVAAVVNAEEAMRHLPAQTTPTEHTLTEKPMPETTPAGNDLVMPAQHHENAMSRAIMAGYAGNLYATNHVFSLTLSERLGVTNFYRQGEAPGIWMQVSKGTLSHRMRHGTTTVNAKNYSLMLGEDREVDYRSKLGFLLGYAQQESHISSQAGMPTKAKVKGYSIGAYYAWQEDNAYKSGAYVNSWLQYQWFNNDIQHGHHQGKYRAKGITASIETGYHLPLYEYRVDNWERHRISVQPQAQLTWQGVKAKNYIDRTGTQFTGFGQGNVQTKIGAKLWLDSHVSRSKINIKPYAEINLVHNSKDFGAYVNGRRKALEGTKRMVEYKTGIDAKVGNNVQLWATFGQRRSKQAYKENQVQVGFKVTF